MRPIRHSRSFFGWAWPLAAILMVAAPAAAQPAKPRELVVQHTEINGIARFSVELPRGIASHVLVKGHYVLMRFSDPVAFDAKAFADRYRPELHEARLGGDHRVVYLKFDESIRLSHKLVGPSLQVEWRRPMPTRPQTSDAGGAPATPAPPANSDTPPAAAPGLQIRVERRAEGATMQFAWSRLVSAAAFMAGDRAVFVFLSAPPRDLDETLRRLAEAGNELTRLDVGGVTAIAWRAGYRLERVERTGNSWRFDLGKGDGQPPPPPVAPLLSRDGTTASFAVEEGTAVVRIVNPATGLPLHIVPSPVSGAGLGSGRRYVTFRLLPALQGAAIEELADGITVQLREGRIDITRDAGLWVTPPQR